MSIVETNISVSLALQTNSNYHLKQKESKKVFNPFPLILNMIFSNIYSRP